ncbi:MAG TPA: capsule biosynthesis protein [Paracoccaceae bacterium]|nr:capsule biosynthesis protein [Paracoccaceae bacterium]HMO70234.1 capsule biosynthesis protein [Paracoccaceae bacterium]
MTTKPRASRFRIRRHDFGAALAAAARDDDRSFAPVDDGFGDAPFPTAATLPDPDIAAPAEVAADAEIDAIRREGLTGRQLRLARRIAQKHGLPATSDFDAVRLLRRQGIDPFRRGNVLDLVLPGETAEPPPPEAPGTGRALATTPGAGDGVQLPQTIRTARLPSPELRAEQNHAADVLRIQQDIARRRRRRAALLAVRLFVFVLLPAMVCAWYYYLVATPLYATKSEFVIQQSSNPAAAAGGLGGLLQGSPLATQQDSIAVQGYLQSREAFQRLDADHGFRAHFSGPGLDPIVRLDPDASQEAAYKAYQRNIRISYDPTEGIIKMEVIAADPAVSAAFARALIGYAEGQVDQLTQRLREDQMRGARESYEDAERKMVEAQRRVVELQEQFKVLSSEVEVSLITAQIGQLETMLTQDRLSLQQMQSNANPNASRMEPLVRRIATLESEIAGLRAKLTEDTGSGLSIAKVQGELLVAQADVQTRQMLLAQSLGAMEAARTEANRQVRYLSLSVSPVPPDEATYPRAFENTMVALMIFAGIYLMVSMTAAILREQVSA